MTVKAGNDRKGLEMAGMTKYGRKGLLWLEMVENG